MGLVTRRSRDDPPENPKKMANQQDAEEELIPEPVYFRLGDRRMDDIENQILGEEEEEDTSDTEMEVTDLTAPPSQAYVHPLTLCMSYPCTKAAELV